MQSKTCGMKWNENEELSIIINTWMGRVVLSLLLVVENENEQMHLMKLFSPFSQNVSKWEYESIKPHIVKCHYKKLELKLKCIGMIFIEASQTSESWLIVENENCRCNVQWGKCDMLLSRSLNFLLATWISRGRNH
jgi:hypothetical protein